MKKKFTRYAVVKVVIEVDNNSDQDINDHIDEIVDVVAGDLDYTIAFNAEVEAGDDASNAIEVPVKIVETDFLGLLEENPT